MVTVLERNTFRDRYYNPLLGQFLSSDPIKFSSGDSNQYRYVENNPIIYRDPSGEVLFTPILVGALVGGGIEALTQLALNGGNTSCLNYGSILKAAGLGALLSGLGPTGFLFGRGGRRAVQYGYSKLAGLLNKGKRRFGWGYNGKNNTDVLRYVGPGGKRDLFSKGPKSGAQPGRDGALSGVGGAFGASGGSSGGMMCPSKKCKK